MSIDWDTRIPIGLIVGMLGQAIVLFFGIAVWGTMVDARVAYLEEVAKAREPLVDRFILLEDRFTSQVETTKTRLSRAEDRLERLERMGGIYDSPRDSRKPPYLMEEEE